jgi:hypothetical protein
LIATAGLSLEQAPPLDLPLRFFLTAPLFAIAAGLLLAVQSDAIIATRWSPAALAATHLLTVGFLGQIMVGALLQLLPVLAGVPLPLVRAVGTAVHLLLSLGAALLALGFLNGGPIALATGALSAGIGFTLFAMTALRALPRARSSGANRYGFGIVMLSLLITVALGLLLITALLGLRPLPRLFDWVQLHAAWGLFGWIGLLILVVGFQLVPLFHVTPAYPRWMARTLVPLLFAILCASSLATLLPDAFGPTARSALNGALGLGFAFFAAVTIALQQRRARPRVDATLLHWWAALGSLLAALLAWLLSAPTELIGILLLVGVGVGLPSGMLFKIVPFLCWFHLQSRQLALGRMQVRIPHMHRLLPDAPSRWQAAPQVAAVLLSAAGLITPALAAAGGLMIAVSASWLLALLGTAVWRYRKASRALNSHPT